MAYLDLVNLQKSFGENRVVKEFSLGIEKGEFVSLLGPSGCGKTTVLRMIGGFERADAGRIVLAGREITDLRANQRNIGMVFQAYALFPNLTVAENVGFGLKIAGVKAPERAKRIAEMLELIGLPDLGARYPFQLSGGQQQRVALARALAVRPEVLLLDEPLSALDAKIRVSLRSQIRAIQRELGITTIFVTHDQEEALSMSDRVVVMNAGVAEQVAAPFEIYNRPATRFVAQFVGSLSQLDAQVITPATGLVEVAGSRFSLGRPVHAGRVALALRPEALHLGADPSRALNITGRVVEVDFMGSVIRLGVAAAGSRLSVDVFNRPDTPPPALGEEVVLAIAASEVIVLAD